MTWNWQQKKWPDFTFDESLLEEIESEFIRRSGIALGSLKHIKEEEKEVLNIELLSDEALKTSEIEGEILNRDSLQSSIRRQFGLKTDFRRIPPAEQGIAEVMVDLYKNIEEPLTHNTLFAWHEMLTNGRRDLLSIGCYRAHEDPMQVVSGPIDRPIIHFEAPPSSKVEKEMEKFVNWFNESRQTLGSKPLIRAAIAHLYFESIHPFEDGNGRIGRAISEKALCQSVGRSMLIGISQVIEKDKKAYYTALHNNSRDLDIDSWLAYFVDMVLEAQELTQSKIDFIIHKAKFYRRFADKLNERQKKAIDRIFREGVKGFAGGLSAKNYMSITGATSSTTTRDLTKLVELGALTRSGERKSSRYCLNFNS